MNPIRRVLSFVKPYWKQATLALVLLTSLVFMDLAIPRLIQRIIDQGIKAQNLSVVISTSLWMLGISALSTLIALGNNTFSVRVGESVARDIREAVFLKVQQFSFSNLDTFSTGKLMVRMTSDASAIQRWVQISLRIGTRAPLLIVGSLILMVNTSPKLALTMLPIMLVILVLIVLFSTKMEPIFRAVQQKLDRLNTVLQENISGVRLVKVFVRAQHETERFEVANQDLTHDMTRVMQVMSAMNPALTILINLGMVLVIWMGGLQTISGDLTVGQLVAFSNYLVTTMTPLLMMTNLANVWANGLASSRRIGEVLETVSDVQPAQNPLRLPTNVEARVEFRAVSFHYDGDEGGEVLKNISFTAQPGERVAILGATGAGKTTLINLIPRFYDVSAGQVLIDGMDVKDLDQDSLLSQIAIVPQETILFSGTIRENICYGRPDATEEETITAAKSAQAYDFILNLPYGLDTHVEERGVNLSGGQKQRLAIARALIMKPKILILDDSTSSVDIETETRIQEALDVLMQGRTSFVVAQRISTVLRADKILVLDHGQIAAQGNHSQLIRSSRVYQEIYESQLGNGLTDGAEVRSAA
ncbi:MAG: ABC transporter ATP-binding protein [Anaerolineaceae bacterium]|nr:ABC transporter ATP-binding protein [Anaerolineaceae bacterium]